MLTIRPATDIDGPTLTAMVRDSGAYDGEYQVMVANQTIDAAYIAKNPVRVADDDGRPVGFYSLQVPGRGEPGEGELDFMFVRDDQQGKSIGRFLAEDIRAVAAQLGLSRIHIVSHPPAEPFYRAIGAVRTGEVAPYGRVTWSRPLLVLEVATP
jgi:GNAT superfamily N-acetyltransferase